MLDDFDNLDSSAFLDDLESELQADTPQPAFIEEETSAFTPRQSRVKLPERRVFGMTAGQRFVIASMLFGSACILGLFFMIVMEKMTLVF